MLPGDRKGQAGGCMYGLLLTWDMCESSVTSYFNLSRNEKIAIDSYVYIRIGITTCCCCAGKESRE